jgi:hypothetical protein
MKKNLHRIDQTIRFGVAAACIYFGFFDGSFIQEPVLAIALGIFGIINLFAASMRFCPFYHLAGISTLTQTEENSRA